MARESYNSAKNIIVGASPLFISKSTAGLSKLDPTQGDEKVDFVSGTSYIDTLNGTTGATKWRNVGYTNNGLQITYNPSYGSVTVDQLLDTAKLFKESMEVMLMTEMAEGTLENLVVVFGQPDVANSDTLSNSNTLQSTDPASATATKALGLAAGALLQAPVERQLCAVGPAVDYSGTTPITGYTRNERVYYARRVLSVQQSQFSLARNTPTTFPVTFRLLPEDKYAGQEYGKIIDRVF